MTALDTPLSEMSTFNISRLAQKASMTCFLNSLLREWFGWSHDPLPLILKGEHQTGIRIELESKVLWIPIKRFSPLGRHEFAYPVYSERQGIFEGLDFKVLSRELINHLQMTAGNPESTSAKVLFKVRVDESVIAMTEVMRHRSDDFQAKSPLPTRFVDAEQYLIVGHSFHPSPKSREGFSEEDRYKFGPEYAGKFPLFWIAVDPAQVKQVSSDAFAQTKWVDELIRSDSSLGELLDLRRTEGFLLYPLNPWQAGYLQDLPAFRQLIKSGRVQILGEYGDAWYPTSSVRALCRPDAPYMLKTSLNVRLTNSIRSLMVKEVDRGIQGHDVFMTNHGQDLLACYPNFSVLYEPAYWCILDDQGEPIEETIIICRMNPFADKTSSQGLVLASLTQDNPFGHASPLARMIEELGYSKKIAGHEAAKLWFKAYMNVVIEPLLMAQANYGILLGAHQQNILVGIKDNLPDQLFFRDCQGTGYSELAYERLKDEVKSLDQTNGNILPGDMALTLFVYYLFINATFNVMTSIAQTGRISEDELLVDLRQNLKDLLAENPIDPSCIEHMLRSQKLQHKGNFLCSISGINENTSSNPFAIYTEIANPLVEPLMKVIPS